MEHYGLLGFPLGHSFSAQYFTEKFEKLKIDADYKNFEFESIDHAFSELEKIEGLRGFNVTIPYKEKIIPFLNSISPEAASIGAVNAVRVEYDRNNKKYFKGYNTDIIGFVKSISPLLNKDIHKYALILGTGGASKAIAKGLEKIGIGITFVSRNSNDKSITYQDLQNDIIAKNKVIVNCTPVGMYPNIYECPQIPYNYLTHEHLLYDLVYNPLETEFLKRGKTIGCLTKNGLEMLHLQAEAAWNIWTK